MTQSRDETVIAREYTARPPRRRGRGAGFPAGRMRFSACVRDRYTCPMLPAFFDSIIELITRTSTDLPPDVRAAMSLALDTEAQATRAGQALTDHRAEHRPGGLVRRRRSARTPACRPSR